MPLEKISRLVGHRTTTVTETVCRKQLRPVIKDAATEPVYQSSTAAGCGSWSGMLPLYQPDRPVQPTRNGTNTLILPL